MARDLALAGTMRLAPMLALVAATAFAPRGASAEGVAGARVINPDLAGLLSLPAPGQPLLAWGTDATLWRLPAAGGRWQADRLPHTATLRALAPAQERLVAVGDNGLLMHAPLNGGPWQPATLHLESAVSAAWGQVACHSATCRVVGAEQPLVLSVNAGADWHAEPAAPTHAGTLRHLAASEGGTWWVAADHALWQRPAGGAAWQPVTLPWLRGGAGHAAAAIDAIAADAEGLIVATTDGRLHELGADGTPRRAPHRSQAGAFTRLRTAGSTGSWMALGNAGACAWRAHTHAPWRACTVPTRGSLLGGAASPDGQHWLVVHEAGLLLHSTDRGRRWKPLRGGVPEPEPGLIEAVAWSPAAGGFVAVGAGGLLLHGGSQGLQWRVVQGALRHYVHDLVATRRGLLAATSYRTLARSGDGGRSWRSQRFDALEDPAFLHALHAQADSGAVVVAGGQGSALVAPDGEHWAAHSSGHGRDHLGLIAEPARHSVLLYGTGGTVTRVEPETATVRTERLPTAAPLYAAFHGPGGAPWLLGGGPGDGGVVVLRDALSGTWQLHRPAEQRLRAGVVAADRQTVLLAGDGGTVLRATQGPWSGAASANWQRVPTPWPEVHWGWIVDAGHGALWLGGTGGALARSTDNGQSWQAVPLPTTAALRPPSHDARRGTWWLPGRDGTLLRSDDGGLSWQPVATQTRAHLKGVHINPEDGSVLAYGARLLRLEQEAPP